ncbi:2-oxoglutarate dehydrogenase E2 component (dihydrolipoamide succinyltransferase) [Dyadobacter jejuensis]|uniref:Dihydrolipoamide acetyltransferase component of pyruvate dehydrogenase complex n=2 Tax=Dyadobacter jejuensis TaxID=1082580 RepID=A0A316AMC7_9BACT|nr:2-oxoglutarate dehydrogenase E2 component (dihydrolipoamide succinyltransferase) [Dyadobacter jejuensis]
MPPLGESILECTVLGQLKAEGDKVTIDESVLEVATDKVDTEVPCPYEGKLIAWLVKENDVVAIGSPVARIEVDNQVEAPTKGDETTDNGEALPAASPAAPSASTKEVEELESQLEQAIKGLDTQAKAHQVESIGSQNQQFYSPLVQSIARQEGLSMDDLASIPGTGVENRLTKNDLLAFLEKKTSAPTAPAPAVTLRPGENQIIAMDRMRKMIAQRMLESKKTSAHVTSFIETDMTPIVNWRNGVKDKFRKNSGIGITFTPILIEAVVKALKDYPMMNISVDGDNIILKKDINIGMAVALPDGNLIVPVIHQADRYSLAGLAQKVNELANKARKNQLKADDLAGGTYTVSNIGAFANLMGTPIIVQPQVGIMAFGAIKKKPAVLETPQGDLIGIRSLMYASHTYDHRVVDGSLGGLFLKRVNDYLENFDPKQTI